LRADMSKNQAAAHDVEHVEGRTNADVAYCAAPVHGPYPRPPRPFLRMSLVLLCHKFRYRFRAAQHGQRDSIVARAATNLLRIVAIEFGTWRSGRNGGSSGLVTFA